MENIHEGLIINERYKLVKNLGQGSYGKVWLAIDVASNVNVAIKFYLSEKDFPDWERFAKRVMDLKHPNLVNVFSFGVWHERPFLVMEYFEEGNAANLIGKLNPCPKDEKLIWTFIHDIASGLAFLHGNNIAHRDIKLYNILMKEGHFFIADFETLCYVEPFTNKDLRKTIKSREFIMFGEMNYCAPEESFSSKPLFPVDIWHLGSSIYMLIDKGVTIKVNELIRKDIYKESRWSVDLKELVGRCLSDNSGERPYAEQIVQKAETIVKRNVVEESYSRQTNATINTNTDNSRLDIEQSSSDSSKDDTRNIIFTHYAIECKGLFNCCISSEAKQRLESILIVNSESGTRGKYGIIDTQDNVIVDFNYDMIYPFRITWLPGPGPYSGNPNTKFIGAFFRQGNNVGYLRVKEDGTIEEYGKCSSDEFRQLCCLT